MQTGSLRASKHCSTRFCWRQANPDACSRASRRRAGRKGALSLSRAADVQGECMTQFDDRERAFESKFAHDEEMKFRITARRNRLLGEWAARLMSLTEAET